MIIFLSAEIMEWNSPVDKTFQRNFVNIKYTVHVPNIDEYFNAQIIKRHM